MSRMLKCDMLRYLIWRNVWGVRVVGSVNRQDFARRKIVTKNKMLHLNNNLDWSFHWGSFLIITNE